MPLDFDLRLGLGWYLNGSVRAELPNAGLVADQPGLSLLFQSRVLALPERKLGVVVLANSAEAREAVDEVATQTLKLALEGGFGDRGLTAERNTTSNHPPPVGALDDLVGQYSTLLGLASVTRHGNSLRAEVLGRKLWLVRRADGGLGIEYRWLGLFPIPLKVLDDLELAHRVVSDRELVTAFVRGQEVYAGEKIRKVPLPDSWRQRVGRYRVVNLERDVPLFDHVRLRASGGLLALEYDALGSKGTSVRLALIPLSDTEAVLHGVATGGGETVRAIPTANGELLRYSGYRFEKIGD